MFYILMLNNVLSFCSYIIVIVCIFEQSWFDGLGWKVGWIFSNGSGDEVGIGIRRSDLFVEVDFEEGG